MNQPTRSRLNHPVAQISIAVSVFVLLILASLLHGRWSGRWQAEATADETPTSLNHVPLRIGEWEGVDIPIDQLTRSANTGPCIMRRYVNRSTGAVVCLYLTSGRPGPLLTHHTPTTCYPSAGYDIAEAPTKQAITNVDQPADFLVASFSKTKGAVPTHLRIFWSWSGDGHWQVPEQPRLAFAHHPRLYKLYVSCQLANEENSLKEESCADFVRQLLPELNRTLFANP